MRVVSTKAELADALAALPGRRAVVMTMGALHEGHLTLVRTARTLADVVVVTIFVNPLQFGPTEDLARYPRDLEGDVAKLAGAGADLVFAPGVAEVYPTPAVVTVSAGRVGEVLEGEFRPAHMDGVLTVVLKLLHLTAPDVALFGQKDAQQLAAIRRMVADLDLGVEIVGVPIVREPDGLALSSRNAYLAPDERTVALALSRALAAGADLAAAGGGPRAVHAAAAEVLAAEPGVVLDYLALVDPALDPLPEGYRGSALLLVAGRVGTTRLIDNVVIDIAGIDVAGAGSVESNEEH
ncbi:pantoate--beta-alanine ligase [Actinotalea sp. M2MS4P-6]|uniref:pantoate--beta-alanine ligase n=1 Tax=Actinotalea sp. M2MS4P-6 TaxID=2983762 RepID=UPI0021E4B6C4|nr:pantoate--beta-alanine ligase [Actinotalea sp. M2MS4P-6]MCV2394998.1 pantoate--beta-alanine ligase [Actinotalea sp. M2MS4P-6]